MHVIDSLAVGGKERMLVDLVNTINPAEYAVSVCVTRSVCTLAREIRSDIPVEILHRRQSWDPSGFIKLKQFSQEQDVDLYHAHGRSTLSFLLVARHLGMINKPILLHDHNGINKTDRSVPMWFRYWGSRQIDYFIGVNENLISWAIDAGVPPGHTVVLGNALDTQRYATYTPVDLRQRFSISKDQKIGIMVGNIRPEKGLDLLIQACSSVPKDILPIFLIVGKIVDAEYVKNCLILTRKMGLEKNFQLVGPHADSLSWMKGADFAVMPSRTESGPLVLIEYMACGLPFVSFAVGGISELVQPEIPDSFAMPENPSQFSIVLQNLLKLTQTQLKNKGIKARQIALTLFDIKNKMPQLYSIYATLLDLQQ